MTTPCLERSIEDVCLADGVFLEDDWYALRHLDKDTLAIGEPAYHQCNWSYLISDADQSLLWDTGSGRRDIKPVVARYGRIEVSAFASHMHHDHLGGIRDFGPVTLADLPCLRALEMGATVTPSEDMFLGTSEGLVPPSFTVGRWVAPGERLRLGTRELTVLHTPGHSPDSVSLWEPDRNRLYAADLVYPGPLYAQVPGACLDDYARSLRMLIALLPQDVEIMCAHGDEQEDPHDVPRVGLQDIEDALSVIETLMRQPPHDGERKVNSRISLIHSVSSWRS